MWLLLLVPVMSFPWGGGGTDFCVFFQMPLKLPQAKEDIVKWQGGQMGGKEDALTLLTSMTKLQ